MSQPVPQTPQDVATTPSAPFVIHVDAPDYSSSSAPQRIPADANAVAKKTDAGGVENDEANVWEAEIDACVGACGPACYAWCLPCASAGDAFKRIGHSGAMIAITLGVLWAATVVFVIVYLEGGKTDTYTEVERRGWHYYEITYYIPHDRQVGFLLGGFACALAYWVAVAKVRHVVRHFYNIPGSWASDLALAFFCTCCVLSQVDMQTARAEKKKAELAATLPAYTEA